MSGVRLILAEFNELSPALMEKFIAAGKLPNFARLRSESEVHLTEAVEEQPHLEPWIQWVTVHSGMPFPEHQIRDLGEGNRLSEKSIWDVLSDSGKRVWICGSMNINYETPINGWVLPDPWTTSVDPYPADELMPYHRFVSTNVQEYTREEIALSRRDQVAFVTFMARNGLTPGTGVKIVKQLLQERSSDVYWKRASMLDRIQLDLFGAFWRRRKPDFATFFLNSTAHFQHLYWRNMEPEHFKLRPEPGEQAVYEDAILYGYEEMDELCGRLIKLAGADTTIMFVTALSQQPCLDYEETGGKVIHRPLDFQRLLQTAGVDQRADVVPVMGEEFRLGFDSEDAADQSAAKLKGLHFQGKPVLGVERRGTELACGCQVWHVLEENAMLMVNGDGNAREVPFFDLFYKVELVKSGMHHPDGMLWIRSPARTHSVHPGKVSLTSIAPTILGMYGVSPPEHMRGEPLPAGR